MSPPTSDTTRDTVVPPMVWGDELLLGFDPMDRVHREFVQAVASVQTADAEGMPMAMQQLLDHALAHFGQEDEWMNSTQFPARECHINEHAAVVQSLREAMQLLSGGDVEVCRRVADELARWFPGHADFLDAALSHWMCKLNLGGKPVVLRPELGRRLAHETSRQP
jgi:hemerythrin